MSTTHCPRCGSANPEAMRFCLRCGTDLLEAVAGEGDAPQGPATLACSGCGRENPASMQFCLQCGAVVAGAPPAPVPAFDPAPVPSPRGGVRSRRKLRTVALATAVAVAAAAAGVGGWWLGRDDRPQAAAAVADVEATIAVLTGEPSTAPPSLSPSDVLRVFEDSGVLSDPAVFLDEGVTIEQESGATCRRAAGERRGSPRSGRSRRCRS